MTSPAVTLLARVRELERGATVGPWKVWGDGVATEATPTQLLGEKSREVSNDTTCMIVIEADYGCGLDMQFIAESRELVPKMRKAIEAVLDICEVQMSGVESGALHNAGQREAYRYIRDIILRELGGDQ